MMFSTITYKIICVYESIMPDEPAKVFRERAIHHPISQSDKHYFVHCSAFLFIFCNRRKISLHISVRKIKTCFYVILWMKRKIIV